MRNPRYDLVIEPRGSLVMFRPLTDAAREWIDEFVIPAAPAGDNVQWFGGALAVEPRYVDDLADGMVQAGLILRMWG